MVKTLKGNIVSKSSKIIIGGCSFTDKDFPIINKRDMKIRYNRDVDLSDVKVWPEIIKEKLVASRIHQNSISSSRVNYNYTVKHPQGGWPVNKEELIYALRKNNKVSEFL